MKKAQETFSISGIWVGVVNAAVTRRYLQKIFSKADQVRGNCSCFSYFFEEAHKDWQINFHDESWRASPPCTESWSAGRVESIKRCVRGAFRAVQTKEIPNFQNIPLFSSRVVQTKLPMLKLPWKTFVVLPSWGWAASHRAGRWFRAPKITARRRRTNPLIV